MLTNLAYFKLLKSLPEDTLSGVNSQLVLLAAAGALNKTTADTPDLSTSQLLASAEFLKQQGLLECIRTQFPSTHDLLTHKNLLSPPELAPLYSPPRAQSSTRETSDLDQLQRDAQSSPVEPTEQTTHQTKGDSSQANSPDPDTKVKEEPRSPSSSSPKPSFRPIVTKSVSPPGTSSTVHWGAAGSGGPPPNKTCTNTTASPKLHPSDSSSILNFLGPFKHNVNVESRLQKYCLRQGNELPAISLAEALSNIDWSTSQAKLNSAHNRRSYNCYWMKPVGPCNRQFLNKDDLYKHLKSHVNDLEALTPATAILQPLNPGCSSCDKSRSFTKVHGRYQPYSKCTKCTRCACRR